MDRDIYSEQLTLDAIYRLAAHGSDLSKPMLVDFYIECDSESVAELTSDQLRVLEFDCVIELSDEGWDVIASSVLIVDADSIRIAEHEIGRVCGATRGKYSGFGSFGNAGLNDAQKAIAAQSKQAEG